MFNFWFEAQETVVCRFRKRLRECGGLRRGRACGWECNREFGGNCRISGKLKQRCSTFRSTGRSCRLIAYPSPPCTSDIKNINLDFYYVNQQQSYWLTVLLGFSEKKKSRIRVSPDHAALQYQWTGLNIFGVYIARNAFHLSWFIFD